MTDTSASNLFDINLAVFDLMLNHLQTLVNNPVLGASVGTVIGAAGMLFWSGTALVLALSYTPQPNLSSAGNPVAQASRVDTQSIGNRNFFGFADAKPTIVIDNLPETKLELVLRGAFSAGDEAQAGAIIEDDKKNAEHYAIGDAVPGDATLKSIHEDRVVLERFGRYETLYFPNDNDQSGIGTRVNTSGGGGDSGDFVDPAAEARRKAIQERIKKLRQQ